MLTALLITVAIALTPVIGWMFWSVGWRDGVRVLACVAALVSWVALATFLGARITESL